MPSLRAARRLLPALIPGTSLLIACSGQDSTTLVAEARAMAVAGDDKAAIIQLKNAVAADDQNPEARFELGKLYFDQRDLASAEKEFRRAREAGYEENAVNSMIARTLLGQREFERILDELPAPTASDPGTATLQALSKAPDAAEIQWHLASAYAQTGARAQHELERLLASGVAFHQEQAARPLLKQLQNPSR